MKKALLFFLTTFFLATISQSQTYWIKRTEIFNFLNQFKNDIPVISAPGTKFLPIIINKYPVEQLLVKKGGDLYIIADQTGRVYKETKATSDSLAFTRIDSTYFSGYNDGALRFVYKDNLYSIGGFGLWRWTGQLRYFDTLNHEWNSIRINKEYRIQDALYYKNVKDSVFYAVEYPYKDVIVEDVAESYFTLIKFDIEKRKAEKVGILNLPDEIQNKPTYNIILGSFNASLVCFDWHYIYLFDFNNNKLYNLTNEAVRDLFFGQSTGVTPTNIFEWNHKIYYTLSNDTAQHLRHLDISMNDFSETSTPLYTPYHSNWYRLGLTTLVMVLVAVSLAVLRKVTRKKSSVKSQNPEESTAADTKSGDDFSNIEQTLIDSILKHKEHEGYITVDEANQILGLNKKSLEIQRRFRNETINRINHKFKSKFVVERDLIDRIKSEDDKRFVYYSINNENAALYQSIN